MFSVFNSNRKMKISSILKSIQINPKTRKPKKEQKQNIFFKTSAKEFFARNLGSSEI